MMTIIIAYVVITKKEYLSFWTKKSNVWHYIVSLIVLIAIYTFLMSLYNIFMPVIRSLADFQDLPNTVERRLNLLVNVFLTLSFLFIPLRSYRTISAELQDEFYEVKRKEQIKKHEVQRMEQIEKYEYSHQQSHAIRKYIHDLPKHFEIIDEMAAKIKAAEISEYIHELQDDLLKSKGEFATGNNYLDELLFSEQKKAQSSNTRIVFSGVFPNEGIHKKDITVVFMNLIENAIEACQRIESHREISISSKIANDRVFFTISNPTGHKSNSTLETSKQNKKFHGYGISNVKDVVNNTVYDGSLSTSCEDNVFTASVDMRYR